MPSRRLQISATAAGVGVGEGERLGEPAGPGRRTGAPRRTSRARPGRIGSPDGRGRQRRHPPGDLAGTPSGSRLVARIVSCGQAARSRSARSAAASMTCSQLSNTTQHRAVGHEPGDGIDGRLGGRLPHPQHAGHLRRHRRRVVHGGQLHERHPVGMALDPLGGGVDGQPGLADPRRAGQRHEPVGVERVGDRRQLVGPTDQRGRLERQVVAVGVQRPQRRELADQVGVGELVHPLRPDQVLQLVRPQIDQPGTVGQPVERPARRWPATPPPAHRGHRPAAGRSGASVVPP